jgi:hypothetical protein
MSRHGLDLSGLVLCVLDICSVRERLAPGRPGAYLEKSEVPERLHATILALAAETTAAPPCRTNT